MLRRLILLFPALFVFACCAAASADEGHEHHMGQETLGHVRFSTSCAAAAQAEFESGLAMLHSFWYEEAQKAFFETSKTDPKCAMAYWGIAMTQYHQLWGPPNAAALKTGQDALEQANSIGAKTERERDYIHAISEFYRDADKVDHPTRASRYSQAMQALHEKYPSDTEAAIFYALSLDATASPADKTFAHQREAGAILEKIFAEQPQHPGVAHYIIHSYDNPALAPQGLNAARRYAKIAPAVPHALHMPSHIFTRLGLWDDAIASNRAAAEAARAYEAKSHMSGIWDQHMHPLDYLQYALLQSGRDAEAKRIVDEVTAGTAADNNIQASAYGYASIVARFPIELRRWNDAAALKTQKTAQPDADAIIYLARALGHAHTGDLDAAKDDIAHLTVLRDSVKQDPGGYWSGQIEIKRLEAEAWLAHVEKNDDAARKLLDQAAAAEDATDKNPTTPGYLVPAHELLGEFLTELDQPAAAFVEYEVALKTTPNRFNGVYGAAHAAQQAKDASKARTYYSQLLELGKKADAGKAELLEAANYLSSDRKVVRMQRPAN